MSEQVPEEKKPQKLTAKEKAWADAFLITLSKAGAARIAKYKGDNKTLAHVGWENYRKAHIQAYLKEKLDEIAMSEPEIIARLSAQASGDMSDFIEFKDGIKTPFLDLKGAADKGLLHLVKKFKYNAASMPEVELYDSKSALDSLAKIRGLMTDKVEHSGDVGLSVKYVNDWRDTNPQGN